MKLYTMKTKQTFITIFTILLSMNCSAADLSLLNENKIFAFVSGGGSEISVDTSLALGTTLTKGALDDSGKVLELGVGYQPSRNYFITLATQKNMLKIADLHNIYGSINYQLSMKSIQPYIGALAGYSQLDWSKRPHVMLLNEDLTSDSFMYGFQAGIDKKIRKNISIFMKYQYIKYDHKIEILNNTSNIKHNSGQNVLIGMRYLF